MTIDITALLVAAITSIGPVILVFAAHKAVALLGPYAAKYLGEKNAAIFQDRVNQVLNAGIGFAVQKGAQVVQDHGGVTVPAKNFMVDLAVNYAVKHAPDLMSQAGDVTEKVLARFDSHPAVQGLYAAAAPANGNEPAADAKAA